ncbi:ATP-binding protein [Alkalihalophilus marmarensis]|uniref:histidine kinase n=1 Tax=Alkalihalophilus marmarensis DSM 21297 TaxID=1188261 RepID=U6SRR7_9BACI|nr:ATP-binding protein [Alkalihalophilus marmarensis]ERN53615.1 histidine kinase [Alkalihalophilus marmarensis DSM 21297]
MEMTTPIQALLNEKNGTEPIHVYYTFSEREKYIKNALDFLSYALDRRYKVLFVEEESFYEEIISHLRMMYPNDVLEKILHQESKQFYLSSHLFNAEQNSTRLLTLISPLLEEGHRIMIWGQVLLPSQNSILSQLRTYEIQCDQFIAEHELTTVCAYNGFITPAYIQTELLKTHKYFMTDDEITISGLYQRDYLQLMNEQDKDRMANIERENKQLILDNEKLSKAYELIARKKFEYWKLLQELPISILITKEHKVVFANEKALIDLELPSFDEIKGESVFHFIDLTNYTLRKQWIDTLDANQEYDLKEVELKLENGSIKTFKLKSIRTWYKGGDAALHVLIDLTPYKLLEQKMIRAEKLNIAGQLAAGIAHEIKNPLTSIKGFYKLIKHGMGKESYYTIIDDELDRIEQIANEFLILSKPHTDVFKVHSISRIIEEVKTLLETQAIIKGNDIITSYQYEEELLITCEETKIKQVFVNLIKNAIEATSNGHIYITVKKRGQFVEISVRDEGCGISNDALARISEPFFTTKEKGTGLGLLICDKIIDNHNGTRKIESREGVGTTFTITFPLMKSPQPSIPVDPVLLSEHSI